MKKKFVFATNNAHKLEEVTAILGDKIELLSMKDIHCNADIPETADTLEGNALLKARYIFENYHLDCFADDTGLEVEAGETFGTIEVVKTISDLFLPLAGEILEQNEALEENPELVNKDPYGEGWLIKMKPADASAAEDLLDAEAYKAVVNG